MLERALKLHQAGDFPEAIREYQQCVAADPGRAEIRSNLGAALVKLGRYEEAIEQYQAALKTAPPQISQQLRLNLALAYYKSFQITEAASQLETLHAAQPGDAKVALLLADCRLRTGEFQKAIDVMLPFEASQDAGVEYVLGMALIRVGRIPEGQLRVDRILGRGESGEGHLLLGAALFGGGNFPAAVQEFSKAEALNRELPSLQSYYGQALLFTGDADGAERAFRKELAANPNDFDANFQLASILSHRGKSAEARPLLERAVQVRPRSDEARNALAHGFPLEAGQRDDSGIAVNAAAAPIAGLELTGRTKPIVLVFGSYTCPKLRTSAAALKQISEKYRGSLDFSLVYIREAHAGNAPNTQWQSTINEREGIDLPAARDLPQKRSYAELCVRKLGLPWPAVVDGMDGAAEKAYGAWPSRVYVVNREGRVAFNSRLGELDFRPAELEAALREILSVRGTDARPR